MQIKQLLLKYELAGLHIKHLAVKLDAVRESIPKKTPPTEEQANYINFCLKLIKVQGDNRYMLVREINRLKKEIVND